MIFETVFTIRSFCSGYVSQNFSQKYESTSNDQAKKCQICILEYLLNMNENAILDVICKSKNMNKFKINNMPNMEVKT